SPSSRRQAGIQTQERRATAREAWTPASAGATKIGIALPWFWRRSTFFVVPALGRDPDPRAARQAREAWTAATAGATKSGFASPWIWRRSTFFVVPALGRDPDTRAARQAREAWTPAYAGATRMRSVALDLAPLNILRRPGARPGSRHKTGAPGARSL